MGSAPFSTAFLLSSLGTVILLEVAGMAAGAYLHVPGLRLIAATRTAQAVAVVALAQWQAGGFQVIGLDRQHLLTGLKKGLIWSAAFAAAASVLFLILLGIGCKPLAMIRSPLPVETSRLALYFFVGGVLGPLGEEIVFRGLIFGYLRRWSVAAAVLISTAIFAAFHLPGLPVTQIAGGVVFALAYHTSGSLMTPITIHILGNLAIFSLSLPGFN